MLHQSFADLRWMGAKLEIEGDLQVDSAVGRLIAVRPTGECISLAEDWRADDANWRGLIDVVENVTSRYSKGKAVALSGRVATAEHSSATTAASISPTATTAAGTA